MAAHEIRNEAAIDEPTRLVVDKAYAQFCAQQHMRQSEAAAERFAVTVTESAAKDYHGLDSAALVRLLTREFPAQREKKNQTK